MKIAKNFYGKFYLYERVFLVRLCHIQYRNGNYEEIKAIPGFSKVAALVNYEPKRNGFYEEFKYENYIYNNVSGFRDFHCYLVEGFLGFLVDVGVYS